MRSLSKQVIVRSIRGRLSSLSIMVAFLFVGMVVLVPVVPRSWSGTVDDLDLVRARCRDERCDGRSGWVLGSVRES